jgi:hypothetical protein
MFSAGAVAWWVNPEIAATIAVIFIRYQWIT